MLASSIWGQRVPASQQHRCGCPRSPVLVVEGAARGSALNKESRIGKKLIEIPQGVKYTLDGLHFTVKVSLVLRPARPVLGDTLLALKVHFSRAQKES